MICEGEQNDPYIRIYENALSKELCKTFIKIFEENNDRHRDGITHKGIDKNVKHTKEMYFSDEPLNKYDHYLFENLQIHLKKYLSNNKWNFENMDDSGYHLQKYIAKEGFYKIHNDSISQIRNNKLSTRVITFLWYLNDVEEGGETLFHNLKVKPKTGKLLLFPATWTYPHSGLMPISNDKYIITGWLWEHF